MRRYISRYTMICNDTRVINLIRRSSTEPWIAKELATAFCLRISGGVFEVQRDIPSFLHFDRLKNAWLDPPHPMLLQLKSNTNLSCVLCTNVEAEIECTKTRTKFESECHFPTSF